MGSFKIMITDKQKQKIFENVFGTIILNVRNPFPETILVDGVEMNAYILDYECLSDTQKERLIEHLSKTFNQSKAEVKNDLENISMPILEKDVALIINEPTRWI